MVGFRQRVRSKTFLFFYELPTVPFCIHKHYEVFHRCCFHSRPRGFHARTYFHGLQRVPVHHLARCLRKSLLPHFSP